MKSCRAGERQSPSGIMSCVTRKLRCHGGEALPLWVTRDGLVVLPPRSYPLYCHVFPLLHTGLSDQVRLQGHFTQSWAVNEQGNLSEI